MPNSEKPIILLLDLLAALGLLTRLPIPVDSDKASARGAAAAWAWPVAGIAVGLLAALAAQITLHIGLPTAVASGIAATVLLTTQVAVTGGLHEDGLADSIDGLWGGWTKTRRLEIMKDSRTGAYGVIALVLSLLLRWQVWTVLIAAGYLWPAAIIIGAASRVPMVALMALLPAAREGGLSHSVGRPAMSTVWIALGLAGIVSLIIWPSAVLPLTFVIGLLSTLWARTARAKIGGQTGDILGASQQWAEMVGLITLASLAL